MEHFYKEFKGELWFDYEDIYRDAVIRASNGSLFVELGSWKGHSAAFMAVEIINSGKDIKFYCVDDWSLGNTREEFLNNIERVSGSINVITMLSWDAAYLYEDNSIDFCFFDAGHKYEGLKKELTAFLPKMKKGGIMAGHDYTEIMDEDNQVYKAVNEMFGQKNISLIRNVWLYEVA